jgi:3'5'-cyclic nucleotide phosphodiesterase
MEPPAFAPLAPEAWTNEPLDADIKEQLHDFVHLIASLYSNQQEEGAYHNLEHAAHVIMSVVTLLHRLIPSSTDEAIAPELLALFFDPVMPFACVLAALVHDVEYHTGTRPGTAVSKEQNSLQMAWALLILSKFAALRQAIWDGGEPELRRFQYLWVHMVLATEEEGHDILLRRRNSKPQKPNVSLRHLSSPKLPPAQGALRLLEYVMQTSDISHRRQHWHTYRKWTERRWHESGVPGNEKLFYEQELLYMDEYVLPLTEQLRDAWEPVRGRQHSLDDMCRAAVKVRDEWKERGPSVLVELSGTTRMSV